MTDDNEIFAGNDSSSQSNGSSQSDMDWQGPPIFQNNSIGVSVWPRQDKNGDWYISLDLPFIDNFNVFVNDGAFEDMQRVFNNFCENFNQK